MTENERPLHGEMLDAARTVKGISQREAARRAGISEGRWRQVVTGVEKKAGGVEIPVNPKPSTLAAMAKAVGLNPVSVLGAAGLLPAGAEADVGGDAQDDGHGGLREFVAAPGATVEAGVTNEDLLAAIERMRADHEMLLAGQRSLSERVEALEQQRDA